MAKPIAWVVFFFFFFTVVAKLAHENNVCETTLDYATLWLNNKNCWYNPDVLSNTEDMVVRNGYQVRSYQVLTEDGYILTTYRVIGAKDESKNCKQPVFILHGWLLTSEVWVDVGNRSLGGITGDGDEVWLKERFSAFTLVENGYDVWLGNFRGTPHSKRHVMYTTEMPKFWNYSFHEIGLYDVSANIDLIRKHACDCKIIYVGHSMGTTVSYVYASLRSEEATENLAGIVSLAPVGYLSGVKSIVASTAPFINIIAAIKKLFHSYALLDHSKAQRFLLSITCSKFPLIIPCDWFLQLVAGPNSGEIPAKDIPVEFSYIPQGGAFKTLVHYDQEVKSGRFRFFDYGKGNEQAYGTKSPPDYPLRDIKVPVHLFYGERDYLGDPEDVRRLYEDLATEKSLTRFADYNHLAFLYGRTLTTKLYPKVLEKMGVLRKGLDGSCSRNP